jgi:hypothetical protein
MSSTVPTIGSPAGVVFVRDRFYQPKEVAGALGWSVKTVRGVFPFVDLARGKSLVSGAVILRRLGQQSSGGSRGGSGHRSERSKRPDVPTGRPPRVRTLREIPGGQQRSDANHEG